MKSIITFSFPEVRVVSSTFIKISKNAKKVYQKHSDQSFLEQTVLLAVSSWPIFSTKCYNLVPLSLGWKVKMPNFPFIFLFFFFEDHAVHCHK